MHVIVCIPGNICKVDEPRVNTQPTETACDTQQGSEVCGRQMRLLTAICLSLIDTQYRHTVTHGPNVAC